ncbi:hypothetical protein DSUL_140046 [Desulfovibrionales bacterium]
MSRYILATVLCLGDPYNYGDNAGEPEACGKSVIGVALAVWLVVGLVSLEQ